MKRGVRSGEDPPAPSVAIRVFGIPKVQIGHRFLEGLRSRKASSILYFLATHYERPVERRCLADQLWPDSVDDTALDNLRRTLHDLRRALGAAAPAVDSVSRSALVLRLNAMDIDVVQFDRAASSSDPVAWRTAVTLYTGPLLDGSSEEWVVEERQRREDSLVRMLRYLAEDARRRCAPAEAAGFLKKAAALCRYSEETHSEWMKALEAAGQYAEAISVFRAFRRCLNAELDIDPGPELREDYRRVRSHARGRLAEWQSPERRDQPDDERTR